MAEIDRIKEQLAWLKVVFALATAAGISLLVAWLAGNYDNASMVKVLLATIGLTALAAGIITINRHAWHLINKLGDM